MAALTHQAPATAPEAAPGGNRRRRQVPAWRWAVLLVAAVYFLLPPSGGLRGPAPLSTPWRPNLGEKHFAGDYTYGSAFALPGEASQGLFRFLVQWPESSPAVAAPNLFVHERIVTVQVR